MSFVAVVRAGSAVFRVDCSAPAAEQGMNVLESNNVTNGRQSGAVRERVAQCRQRRLRAISGPMRRKTSFFT